MKFICTKCHGEFQMSQARTVELPVGNVDRYCGNCYQMLIAVVLCWIKGTLG